MKIFERNLQGIGNSLLVTLPKEWVKLYALSKGDPIKLMTTERGQILIAPEFNRKEEDREVSIEYDSNFVRRFFREYFNGNQKIRILFNNLKKTDRQFIYGFLKKFMNVQIIEDVDGRIVVKCFKIDDLSIDECLKRMSHICASMFEERISEGNQMRLDELEELLTKFYYMLVMQIRRFLTEGKYAEHNQISLVRAMDVRMAAEKIERIADAVKRMDNLNKNEKEFLKKINQYYSKASSSFLNQEFKNALNLWDEERRILNLLESEIKKQRHFEFRDILSNARQIASLVR